MASLKEIIEQAISDFDGIEKALEEYGIDVSYGTDTSEYGNLVRELGERSGKLIIEAVDPNYFAVDENKTLLLLDIDMAKVVGLQEALNSKVQVVDGCRLITDKEIEKLDKIESEAQVNLIEIVKVGGVSMPIVEKAVNIPIANAAAYGVVKSSEGENKVTVQENGEMYVGLVNINTLVQTVGDELVLYGGSSC